jgi:4-hydroxy-4-methyl-2-oxoglutarate aldolase
MAFPVWSKCVSALGTVKETLGSVNTPVVCAGQAVEPGDVVVADDDGVVVVPRDEAAWAVSQCEERVSREDATRARLAAGELGLDIYDLRAKLDSLGVTYPESPE